uniref:ATP-binding cassette transporter subfamily A member 3 X2 n=1 Tax=Brachionus rotundiformis TaxID=96890 RepID=A0A7H9SKR1_9BILA|nr:ATP-binding cassette transporter subfamily A member 3 X2 [Brachionus rotundiformis]
MSQTGLKGYGSEFKTNLKQIWLLMWKNFTLQKRGVIGTLIEILVPTLFVLILLPIRRIVKSDQYLNNTLYDSFSIDALPSQLLPELSTLDFNQGLWTIGYCPKNVDLIKNIMEKVENDLLVSTIGFDTEEEMVKYLTNVNNTKNGLGGVSFLDYSLNNFTYKIRLSYSPRYNQGGLFKRDLDWKTQFIYSLFPILGPREKNEVEGGDPGYYREGFISIQKAIDFALIYQFNDSVINDELRLKRFPYPPYNDDKFIAVVQALFPFIIMLSFIFTVILTAKAIAYEKETGIKEAMKLMGMKRWTYWLSWYIKTFLLILPGLLFMIIGFKVKVNLKSGGESAIIDKTDPYLLTLFLFLYASSSITFTFLCSTFFKKANSAAAGAGIIWFFSYLPYIFISLRYEKMTMVDKVLSLFVNNLAMSEGVLLIGMFEGKGTGINFSNWNEGISVDDSFSMTIVLFVMFINNIIHIMLTYYFDSILPGDHGIAKPWNFPFLKLYSFFEKKFTSSESYHSFLDDNQSNKNVTKIRDVKFEINGDNHFMPVFIEDETVYSNRKIGIKIDKISKNFRQLGTIKQAVNDLSLNIYEGQISVLLGHNGAGKSTTISMITGLAEPTSGRILVNDIDVVKNTKKARKCIGFCPQYNLLFDNLTVYEHLKFFSKLKENFNDLEIDNMLELINLKDKKHALAKTLSGGMKRKLCVAIAFIGNSSIVILDEPSSGMDPQARHSTWTLLQKFKKERKCTILLTTHFMDEADFLGDRIAIMSKGSLRCCGSPLFLKSKYGSGYNLVLTKKIDENKQNHDKEIINLVTQAIPKSKLNTNLTSEISFVLPSDQTAKFSYLLDEIDKHREMLNIMNVGISVTTIEDVFLKIGDQEHSEEIDENEIKKQQPLDSLKTPSLNGDLENVPNLDNNDEFENFGLWAGADSFDLIKGISLLGQQFYALIIKRLIHSMRNKALILTQIVIPVCCLLINLFYLKYAPIKPEDSPALEMTLNRYQNNFVPIKFNISSSNENFEKVAEIAQIYQKYVNTFKSASSFYLENNSSATECPYQRNNIDEYIGCLGRLSLSYIVDDNLVATEFTINDFNDISIIGHFNNQPFHIPPLAISLITSTLLKFYTDESSKITVINHPLPRNLKDQLNDMQLKDVAGFNISTGLTFGLSFLIASFALFLIKERANDAKHVQYLSGCNSYIFWLSAFFWDLLNYFISVSLVPIFLEIFNIQEFMGGNRWIYVVGLLFLYGFSHIPQMYLFSYLFTVPATGFAALVVWNIMSSQATLTPTQILTLPQLELVDVSKLLEWIFLVIFPNFTFGQGMIDLYNNYQITKICQQFVDLCPYVPNPCCYPYQTTDPNKCGNGTDCLLWTEDYMSWEKPGLLRFFVFMPLQFFTVFGLILFYEAGYFRYFKYIVNNLFNKSSTEVENEEQVELEREYGDIKKDQDVIDEETRISEKMINPIEEIFVVDGITKHYSNFMAVKGISFTLKSSECFGLLGVNGAGKSTSFKMLTGDEYLTKGDASINRISIKDDIKKYQKKLGYCPQFDPLIDQMTVMETMIMYARLRGLKPKIIRNTCLSLINLLDLDDHVGKMCYTLSGGNKRKLSVAIALIGSPLVVLLDEPTSGMDPITRRTLWNCLIKIKNKGKSLILTTHSMDETEVLCSNIGIMVNGEFKCIGSLQHLKSKYGEGYTLMVKICVENKQNGVDRTNIVDGNQIVIEKSIESGSIELNQKVNQFTEFILDKIKNSYVKESRDGFVNIHINDNSTSVLSAVFSIIEEIKDQFSIEYYLVTQTKLEQIFLNFASKQIDPETRVINKSIFRCC